MTILNADRWIKATLANDVTVSAAVGTRIYQDKAPAGTTYPLIVFNFVSLLPVQNMSADRVLDDEVWRVKVISNVSSYAGLETLADRIRTIFHKASGTGVIGCVFEATFRQPEDESGEFYKALILEFRLFTQ